MAEVEGLVEAVRELVRDGDAVAMEGFTHLIPFAAGHEVLRQGRRELELAGAVATTEEPTHAERSALQELPARG